jgi:hypothetical protein
VQRLISTSQVSAGALPPILGVLMAACFLASVAACYMYGNQCFKPRVSPHPRPPFLTSCLCAESHRALTAGRALRGHGPAADPPAALPPQVPDLSAAVRHRIPPIEQQAGTLIDRSPAPTPFPIVHSFPHPLPAALADRPATVGKTIFAVKLAPSPGCTLKIMVV